MEVGRQDRDVIPASWPTRRASNVIENCRDLLGHIVRKDTLDN